MRVKARVHHSDRYATSTEARVRSQANGCWQCRSVEHQCHPLVRPTNRIRVWVDASEEAIRERWFERFDVPVWPEMPPEHRGAEWHGLMTSVTAAGNGCLSNGHFRGLASESDVALVRVSSGDAITSASIARGLRWLRQHAAELGLRVISLSVAGDEVAQDADNEIDDEVEALVADGVVVVAAAGNDGIRRLIPPATSVDAITVGGVDDHNSLRADVWDVWHSNYGMSRVESRPHARTDQADPDDDGEASPQPRRASGRWCRGRRRRSSGGPRPTVYGA